MTATWCVRSRRDPRSRHERLTAVYGTRVLSVQGARIRGVATDEELKWALTYDGYERFSRDMSAYYELLRLASVVRYP